MTFPLITKELIGRLANGDPSHRYDRMCVLQALPNNPYGIEFHNVDNIRATISTHGGFNSIHGIDVGDADQFDAVMALYRERGVKIRLGIVAVPGYFDEDLARRFVAHGFFAAVFHGVLYGVPLPLSRQPRPTHSTPEVSVERVNGGTVNSFVATLCEGWGMPPESPTAQTAPAWLDLPNWYLYLARVDGCPAAAAILNVHGGVGFLASGATAPSFRGRGCQMALIRRRIADAHALGCDLILGGGEFCGVSQRNQERAGLRMAYTYTRWKELDLS